MSYRPCVKTWHYCVVRGLWLMLMTLTSTSVWSQVPRQAATVAQVEVPRVTGRQLADAQEVLQRAGFQSESKAEGPTGGVRIVVNTIPEGGTKVPSIRRPVVVLVHRGQPATPGTGEVFQPTPPPGATTTPRMPDLSGMTCQMAQERIERAFRARLQCALGTLSGSVEPGRINRQSPEPRTVIRLSERREFYAWLEPSTVEVPSVTGTQAQAAIDALRRAGLRPSFGDTPNRWQWVGSQDPAGGSRVAPQSTVRLGLVGRYLVPNILGRTCADAERVVRDQGHSGLRCVEEAGSGNPAPGLVHTQSPPAGAVLSQPQTVEARFQPQQVVVPDVVGFPETQAVNMLRQLRLGAALTGPDAGMGRQVRIQAPAAGTSVLPGREVTLTMGLTVPRLTGFDCPRASSLAREYGFPAFTCEPRLAGASESLRRIFEQSPTAGTVLTAPQPVTALFAQPVQVPNVVGRPLNEAMSMLTGAPLEGRPDASNGDRVVIGQLPGPGSEATPRSSVALTTQRYELVPRVVGMLLDEAQTALAKAEFKANPDQSDRIGQRKVEAQQPTAGERVPVGRSVGLTTYIEVEVPDVVNLMLPEAEASLSGRRLVARPDRDDKRADRQVRSQQPAALSLVKERSEIKLNTVRLVRQLPPLEGRSCKQAKEDGDVAGVNVQCKVDSLVGFALGEPVVKSQPSLIAPVVEGSTIEVLAVPPWWSTPTLLLLALSPGLGFGGRTLYRKLIRPRPAPPDPTPVPDPLPGLALRMVTDPLPSVTLRPAHDDHGIPQNVHWQIRTGEAVVFLRMTNAQSGESDGPH